MNITIEYPQVHQKLASYEMFRYPGGEVQVRLTRAIVDKVKNPIVENVIIIARITDGDIIPVAQLVNAVRGATSADIKLVLPYLPYSRADRRFVLGDTFGLQVFAQTLNTMAGVDIITLDAHSGEAAKLIRHFTDVSPKPIIDKVLNTMLPGSTNILLPDKGAARYGFGSLMCEKVRDPETGKLSGFKVPPRDAFGADNILIIDDICDGGGTFTGIADALRGAGVDQRLYLYVTHGIFSQGFTKLFKNFSVIFTTDSYGAKIPTTSENWHRFFTIPCTDTIIAEIKK